MKIGLLVQNLKDMRPQYPQIDIITIFTFIVPCIIVIV